MYDLIDSLAVHLKSGGRAALATIVGVRGSTPRSTGARMIVTDTGGCHGTIGGGASEGMVISAAREILASGLPRIVVADLTEPVTESSEAPCGGVMEVLVVPWDAGLLPVLEALQRWERERRKVRLLTCLEPAERRGAVVAVSDGVLASAGIPASEAAMLAGMAGGAGESGGAENACDATNAGCKGPSTAGRIMADMEGRRWTLLCETLTVPAAIIICGGGHIALPLSWMASIAGFRVTIIDDRPEYASKGRFPWATQVVCGSFGEALDACPIDEDTSIAIATHGHSHDLECVKRALARNAAYTGLVSSRRRLAGLLQLLVDAGVDQLDLGRLRSPAGLDIAAETPEEIAVAILAEIIMLRRGGRGGPLVMDLKQGGR
ncbi:MAG: XdhC family protein [Ignavibacteriales bacterium]